MNTFIAAPLAVVLAVLVLPSGADKAPSLISAVLDLLPELEELSGSTQTVNEIPAVDARKAEDAIEIFSLFTPFIRGVIEDRAKAEKKPISESVEKSLDTVQRLIPKFMNVVLALGSRAKANPDDEPLLEDFTGLLPRGSYGAPRQSQPSESDETSKLNKEVISKVLQQSGKLITQLTAATVRADSDVVPSTRIKTVRPTNYYISSETTRRPKTRRRRPSSQRSYTTTTTPRAQSSEEDVAPARSYTPRPTYTTTAAPAPRDDSDEEPALRTYSTSTRVSTGSQPGSSVSFFTLPTSRTSRRQRVTRGSDYQVKPQRYFYLH